jgi:hypothetical protein
VITPGSAIGSTIRNEKISRPKNWKREIATAAIVPSTSAIAVEANAAFSERSKAARASGSFQATRNQRNVTPGIGQLWMLDVLKA